MNMAHYSNGSIKFEEKRNHALLSMNRTTCIYVTEVKLQL